MQHVLSNDAVRRPFDPEVVIQTDCMITSYQNVAIYGTPRATRTSRSTEHHVLPERRDLRNTTCYQNVYYFADSFVDAKNKLRYYLTSPHLTSSQLTSFHPNWTHCDWPQPRRNGSYAVERPSLRGCDQLQHNQKRFWSLFATFGSNS